MLRTAILALTVVAVSTATLLLFQSKDPTVDVRVGEVLDGADGGVLENLGIPRGPFDPVLSVPADRTFMTPPTNHVVSDPTGEGVSIVQSEVTIAVQGDFVVAGWNDGQGFVDGTSVSGYGYSTDRGDSWTDGGDMPDGGGVSVFGDPSVIATNSGTFVFASLNRGSSNGNAINRGTFSSGAINWNSAVAYNDSGSLDKEYLEYDEVTNRIWLTYVNLSNGNAGRLSFSDDEGQTWSNPVTVNPGGQSANGFYPATGIDGEVYVSWVQPLFQGNADVYIRRSPDGVNFPDPRVSVVQLGPNSGGSPQCFSRGVNITWGSVGVDKSDGPFRGRVYTAYSDGGSGTYNVFVKFSDDQGQTWSSPIQVNDNANSANTEQFWPQLDVGPEGRVTVGWYDRRYSSGNNSLCDFYVGQSVDGGAEWTPNRRASDTSVAWCGVPNNITPNFGDYIETIVDDRSVFAIWSDARGGGPDAVTSRIDDVQTLATTYAFGDEQAVGSTTATAWFIPNVAELRISPSASLDSEAELLFVGAVFGLLATPAETNGIFQIGGEALSGRLALASDQGDVVGDFELTRTDDNGIDLDFSVRSDAGLHDIELTGSTTWNGFLVGQGPGDVGLAGNLSIGQFTGGAIDFSVSGLIHLDGAPTAEFELSHEWEQRVDFEDGFASSVRTRTLVEDGVVVAIPDVTLGENLPPIASIKLAPNPWESGAQIRFQLSHPAEGVIRVHAVDGRVVRRIAEGVFEAGEHVIAYDGTDDEGKDLPNGGYFIRLDASNVQAAGKLIITR